MLLSTMLIETVLVTVGILLCGTVDSTATNASLSAPNNYIIYSGDLDVNLYIPKVLNITNGAVELILTSKQIRITTFAVPRGLTDGSMSVRCGVLNVAGNFVFRLVDRSSNTATILAQSSVITAVWPSTAIQLSLPTEHKTLDKAVSLNLTIKHDTLKCDSVQQGTFYNLQLIYLGKNESDSTFETRHVVNSKKFVSLSLLGSEVLYQCELIDQAGMYEVVLSSAQDDEHHVAVSNIMFVAWSNSYSLRQTSRTIFPCSDVFSLEYVQPSCTQNEDKIRLYRQKSRTGTDLHYITERRAQVGSSQVSFVCRLFNETAIGYCFKYVSTANNGAVTDQRITCVPTAPFIDAGWSTWSEWGNCVPSLSACGSGQRIRHRVCDNPPPSNYAPHCTGSAVEYKLCKTICDGVNWPPASEASYYNMNENCICGCTKTESSGYIVAPVNSSFCHQPPVWTVFVPDGNVIHLSFIQLLLRNSQNLRVRDGNTTMSNLLAFYDGKQDSNRSLTSSHNVLRLEFVSSEQGREGSSFVAFYNVTTAMIDSSNSLPTDGKEKHPATVWHIYVVVVVVICTIIVFIVVIILYQKSKGKDRLLSTPAHESLLSSHHQHHEAKGFKSQSEKEGTACAVDSPAFENMSGPIHLDESTKSSYHLVAPIATDDEELSPSHSYTRCHALLTAKTETKCKPSEQIQLTPFSKQKESERSRRLEKRPPVEGQDSNTKCSNYEDVGSITLQTADYVPPAKMVLANVKDLRCVPNLAETTQSSSEPIHTDKSDIQNDLDSSASEEQSQLFSERPISPVSDIVADDAEGEELEYDDYIPQLPGSYFSMDPQAYTLTWSKQPTWLSQPIASRTASDISIEEQK